YIDEDSFAGMSDVYDQGGKLFRTGAQNPAFSYVDPVPISYMYGFYDLAQNNYSMCCFSNTPGGYIKYKFEPQPAELWNPDHLVRAGVRWAGAAMTTRSGHGHAWAARAALAGGAAMAIASAHAEFRDVLATPALKTSLVAVSPLLGVTKAGPRFVAVGPRGH